MAEKKFSHIGIKRKVSDFLQLEDGNVGKRNVMAAGTVIGASVLGQMLFAALANADPLGQHFDSHSDSHTNYWTHSNWQNGANHGDAL